MKVSHLQKGINYALLFTVSVTLVSLGTCPKGVKASADDSASFVPPPPPDDIADSGQRTAAASRGKCETPNKNFTTSKSEQVTALVPIYSQTHSGLVWGTTSTPHPIFWFYVPIEGTHPGKFVLQTKNDKTIYETSVLVRKTPGSVGIALPPKVTLKIGQHYHWFFNFYCGQAQSTLTFVDGWITRRLPSNALSAQLRTATREKRVALLAANGYWYDALSTSAELKSAEHQDNDWDVLLRSVGLANIATKPTFIASHGEN